MSTRDRVRLSARERQQLAAIQAMLEAADPELAKVLSEPGLLGPVGRHKPGASPDRGPAGHRWARRTWAGPVVVMTGVGLVLGTISSATWLGVPGILLTAAGLGLWVGTWKEQHSPQGPSVTSQGGSRD